MISSNFVPEKINEFNAYLAGVGMIGVAASIPLPPLEMMSSTISGVGISGEIDSPTLGQFRSIEQDITFNILYSSAMEMVSPLSTVDLTFRAAQQVYDKNGGYTFKGLRIVERGRVKSVQLGKIEKGATMDTVVKLEVTYILIEVDGETLMELDKLNTKYYVKNRDMLAEVRSLI
ncbi:MAG: phage major tail tube protein [Clostridia bacterium]|nr:phage major tail tube protein [Clostridia bacterium]